MLTQNVSAHYRFIGSAIITQQVQIREGRDVWDELCFTIRTSNVHFIQTYLYLSLFPVDLPVLLRRHFFLSSIIRYQCSAVYDYTFRYYLLVHSPNSNERYKRILYTHVHFSAMLDGPNHPKSNGNSIESPIELYPLYE